MTIDERLEALAVNIESLHSSVHELYETVQQNSIAIRGNSVNIESLHSSVHELYETVQQNSIAIRENSIAIRENSEHIRALVRVAEIHERRLSDLEGNGDGTDVQ